MKPWWEKWPGRLDHEIAELEKVGIHPELHKGAFEKGPAVLNFQHLINGVKKRFIVIFPDIYPYTRFEIYAPELHLSHHQNPFDKNLCMIGRSTSNWHTSDTVAGFIIERLPKVIDAGECTDPDTAKNLEEIQGEPITYFYPYAPNHIALVDSSWVIDSSVKKGILKIGISDSNSTKLNLAVLTVLDNDRNVLAQARPEISDLYQNNIIGKWVRSDHPILERDENAYLLRLLELDRMLVNPKLKLFAKILVMGVVFPEEVGWRENKDSWHFLVLR